jgi:hypothetical protein
MNPSTFWSEGFIVYECLFDVWVRLEEAGWLSGIVDYSPEPKTE